MEESGNTAVRDRRLRILAVSEDNPYVAGGRVAYWTVVHELAAQHDVKLVALDGATEDLFPTLPGEHRVRLPIGRFRTLLFPLALLRVVKSFHEFDLVFTSQGFAATFILVIARMKRLPAVTYIHDSFTLEELLQLSPKNLELLGAAWRYISSYAFLRFYTAVLCISETAAARLRRSGVKDNRLWLTYTPVKHSPVSSSSMARDDRLLLVVARVEANKRPDLALELMKHLTGYNMAWIGGGNLAEEYTRKSAKMGLSISFLGRVAEDAKWRFLAKARCLLSFSEFEGFWIPGFEALSVGTPVIALRLPVLEEVYGHKIEYAESVEEMARKVREVEPLRPESVPILYSPQNVADRAEACLLATSSASATRCASIQPWKVFLIPKECRPARVIDMSYGTQALYRPFLAHLGDYVRMESKYDAKGHLIVSTNSLSNFLDGEFGYLWSSEILEHLPTDSQNSALREWMRIARHGCVTYATERHLMSKLNPDHNPVEIGTPANATHGETADGEALIQW